MISIIFIDILWQNFQKNKKSHWRIVFMDTGLCAYLCKWDSAENLMNSSVSGHYLETFIISEIIKNKRNSSEQLDYDIYFYRDRDVRKLIYYYILIILFILLKLRKLLILQKR